MFSPNTDLDAIASASSRSQSTPLSYHGIYHCPVCRYGQIAALTLTEAFGCSVCRHIFTTDLEQRSLEMAGSSPALRWYWTGQKWVGAHRAGIEVGWGTWIAAIAFVLLPPTIVGLAAYTFPPLPGSPYAWFPIAWTVLAFLTHLAGVVWLLVEYYQFPVLVFLRTWGLALIQRSQINEVS